MRPNLFEIATKELSQDGFFTWLLQWADPEHRALDTALHECATAFVKMLIQRQLSVNINISKVRAGRQWENIDIWAEVNDAYLIVIEDKTFTGEQSNQLETYKKTADGWCEEKNYKPVYIYLKTGSESLSSLNTVKEKGYAVVDRAELLALFTRFAVTNDIFVDFIERLRRMEKAEQAFETTLIKDWDFDCWTGFYRYLETRLDITDWRYVPNQSGGFLGIWWHFLEWNEYPVYLQIEQGRLCFKIGEVYEDHREVRNTWFEKLMTGVEQQQKREIVKPPRFGSGTYMAAVIVQRTDWLGKDGACIDKEAVIERLKAYESFLDYCVQ
ncbi:hypothetical protein AGMMS50268_02600 [Spirochaetia bacterium]|nr:hypothetical protein AGMMS50268_02600 [Spirochaetia bacterium]